MRISLFFKFKRVNFFFYHLCQYQHGWDNNLHRPASSFLMGHVFLLNRMANTKSFYFIFILFYFHSFKRSLYFFFTKYSSKEKTIWWSWKAIFNALVNWIFGNQKLVNLNLRIRLHILVSKIRSRTLLISISVYLSTSIFYFINDTSLSCFHCCDM